VRRLADGKIDDMMVVEGLNGRSELSRSGRGCAGGKPVS
jgi:hypothetical protein